MIPNRIELAARAMFQNDTVWEALTEGAKRAWMDFAAKGLKAAFPDAPGLFEDTPQVWLAPVDATAIMQEVADLYFDQLWAGEAERDGLIAARLWGLMADAARDAHLASQSDKPEKGEA